MNKRYNGLFLLCALFTTSLAEANVRLFPGQTATYFGKPSLTKQSQIRFVQTRRGMGVTGI